MGQSMEKEARNMDLDKNADMKKEEREQVVELGSDLSLIHI